MPAKSVVQYTCDRCERVWYVDPDSKVPERKLSLDFSGLVPKDSKEAKIEYEKVEATAAYECLCDGCAKTVGALVKQIAKEFKPRAPRAKKKDTATSPGSAGQGSPQPTDPPTGTTTDVTPAVQRNASASSPPAPSSVGAPSGAGGQRPSPPAAPHPRR